MRLLIADDEQYTCESLLQCVDFKALGISYVDVAYNGKKAYEICQNNMPDILLSDIRMPIMDGITLATKLRALSKNLKIVFISGYADKEYLKSAIALQAIGYVEKPIKIEELVYSLKQCVDQLSHDLELAGKASNNQNTDAYKQALFNQQIADILTSDASANDMIRILTDNDALHWPDSSVYSVATICLSWEKEPDYNAMRVAMKRLLTFVQSAFDVSIGPGNHIASVLDCRKLVLFVHHTRGANAPASLYPELYTRITRSLEAGCVCQMVYSASVSKLSLLAESSLLVYRSAEWMVFIEALGAICYHTNRFRPDATRPDRIRQAVLVGNDHIIRSELIATFKSLSQQSCLDITDIRQYLTRLLEACTPSGSAGKTRETLNYEIEILKTQSTLREAIRYLFCRVNDLFPEIIIPEGIHPKIASAISYIRQNLSDSTLSVQRIAASLSINSSYLISLYRRETGVTIGNAITQARIRRATWLLMQGLNICEVAEQSGFSDPSYFSMVFKKKMGVTPKQYRVHVFDTIKKVTEQ